MSFDIISHNFRETLENMSADWFTEEDEQILFEGIRKQVENIGNESTRVSLVGLFNSGKSTILNALIGTDILPRKLLPTTGVITQISYGDKYSAVILYEDGHTEEIVDSKSLEDLSRDLERTIQIKWDSNAEAVIPIDIKTVQVKVPVDLFKPRYIFVDTPGLHDANIMMTARTYEQLRDTDIAILVFNNALGEKERALLSFAQDQLNGNMILLFNHNPDLHDEADTAEILEWVTRESSAGVSPPLKDRFIFTVRGLEALKSRVNNGQAKEYVEAQNQLADLESYFLLLAQNGKRTSLVLQSRLCILRNLILDLQALVVRNQAAISEELETIETASKTKLDEQRRKFLKMVEEAELALERLHADINTFGQSIPNDTVSNARNKMANQSEWDKSLSSCLDGPIQEFVGSVRSITRDALEKLNLSTQDFAYSRTVSISAADNPGTKAGAIVGGTVGLFGGLVGATIGAAAGAKVGQWLGDDAWKDNSITNVKACANTERRRIEEKARIYVTGVKKELQKFKKENAPIIKVTSKERSYRKKKKRYEEAVIWIQKFIDDIDELR